MDQYTADGDPTWETPPQHNTEAGYLLNLRSNGDPVEGLAERKQSALANQVAQPGGGLLTQRSTGIAPSVYGAGQQAIQDSFQRQQAAEQKEKMRRIEEASQTRPDFDHRIERKKPKTVEEQKLRDQVHYGLRDVLTFGLGPAGRWIGTWSDGFANMPADKDL